MRAVCVRRYRHKRSDATLFGSQGICESCKKLADEYGFYFLELQEDLERKADEFGTEYYLADGVHPNIAGAQLIADKWVKLFDEKINQ